jgi:hypothetical protein
VRRRRAVFAIAASALVPFALVLAEGAARLAGKRPRPQTVNGYFFVADPKLGWRNLPNGRYEWDAAGSVVTTGRRGERNGVRSSSDPTGPTVLFVGDSTTFCAEVNDDETGPSEVAKLLPPEDAPFVVNAGVRAYGTVQAVRMAEEWLARAPIKVVVYTYADNDFVENVNPIVYLPAWAPRARFQENGELVIDEPPEPASGWGESLEDDTLLPWNRRMLLRLARHSSLAATMSERLRMQVSVRQLEDGAFGPIGTGGQWGRAVTWANARGALDVIRELTTRLGRSCEAHGAKLIATRFTTSSNDGFFRSMFYPGADVAVPLSSFSGPPDTYRARMKDGSLDAHYGPLGTKTYAQALAPHILELLRKK